MNNLDILDANLVEVLKPIIYVIKDLTKRVKALEQKDSYYPTQEEINNIKEVRNLNG